MARYRIVPSYKVPNAGIYPIRIGYPIPEHTVNDVCLCCEGTSEFIPLNSRMLREALLSDPKGVETLLGLRVTDALADPRPVQAKPVAEEPKPKPKKKRQEPLVEDLGAIERSEIE